MLSHTLPAQRVLSPTADVIFVLLFNCKAAPIIIDCKAIYIFNGKFLYTNFFKYNVLLMYLQN